MERLGGLRRDVIVGFQNLAVAAVLFGSAQLGLVIGLNEGRTSPFWPPTGIAVTALLLLGLRTLPGILAGLAMINLTTTPPAAMIPTAIGSTLACMCAFWALRRVGFDIRLDRLKDALALVFLAAFGAMLISSTNGTALLLATGVVTPHTFLPVWLTWWTGDAMGVLVVAPFLLTLAKIPWRRYRHIGTARLTELTVLLAGSFGLVLFTQRALGIVFLAFPLIVWAAWRYQLPGAAPVAVLTSAVAIHAAVHGYGTFAGRDLLETMLILQLFNGSIALTGILLSVAITERQHTREELEDTCRQLGQAIGHLDRAMRPDDKSHLRGWAEQQQDAASSSRRRSDRGQAN
ncbi:MASE1 domain-containing protein [Actinopolymorpha sp. B11F2]|uniref:MASE1 domain-containing protein n=1 Tax=Actinopolymorpha sp. B11F2 TaxID=3160862 RepID=UPI0032E3E0DC